MKKKEYAERLAHIEHEMSLENRLADLKRIRGFTIGTAFGGTTEISMRVNNGDCYWGIFQPVEVVELIHQLAANIGCHIHILPRKDFATWRDWKYTEQELEWFRGAANNGVGWAPHPKGWHENQNVAATLPPPEQQPGLNIERKENELVAIEKPKNRRGSKRTSKIT